MNRIDQLREQIDACRAGSDDLHLPELAGLAQAVNHDGAAEFTAEETAIARELDRSQRFDQSVVSALHDVSVPAGLLDRLLARTEAATLEGVVDRAVESADATPAGESTVAKASTSRTGRRWLIGAGVLAASALAVGAVLFAVRSGPRDISHAELVNQLIPAWNAKLLGGARWATVPPPAGFTNPLARRKLTTWTSFRTAAGEQVVAYDMTPGPKQPKVFLFAVATSNRYKVPANPTALSGTTGGVQVAAWQPAAGGLLFVLFIDRDGPDINDYIRPRPLG